MKKFKRPYFIIFRLVFGVDTETYLGHMKSVKQSVLDGTSKWSAKIAITGKNFLPAVHIHKS